MNLKYSPQYAAVQIGGIRLSDRANMSVTSWLAIVGLGISLTLNIALFVRGAYYQNVVQQFNLMVAQDHTDIAVLKTSVGQMESDIHDIKLALGVNHKALP